MKIAVICSRYISSSRYHFIGGAEVNTHGILKELAKRHEVTVLTPFRVNSEREEVLDGVRVKRFWNIFNPLSKYPYVSGFWGCPGLIKELLRENYDLIHMYPGIGKIGMLNMMPQLIRNIPSFLTVYDLQAYSTTYDYRSVSLERIDFVNKWALRRFDYIFSISTYEIKVIERINKNSSYLPCGVDLEEFDNHKRQSLREKFGIQDKFFVLDISRITEYKGQHILIQAIPEIVKEEREVRFVFVGPVFDERYYARLRQLVKELNIEKFVVFTGSLDSTDVVGAYFDCDLHILPVYFLNFPDTVIEAWAARKPVIVSNRVDPPWIVEEGKDGYFFNIENREELVEKTLTLLHDKELREQMGEAGRKKVEGKFTFDIIADEVEATYNKVIFGKEL